MRRIRLACALAAPASADRGLAYLEHARFEARTDVGFASALGFGGLAFSGAPSRWFLVEAGVGYGFTGLQLSLMPKVTLGSLQDRFVAGVGIALALSNGHSLPSFLEPDGSTASSTATVWWLNLDLVGYQHRFRNGVAVLAAAGMYLGLGGTAANCRSSPAESCHAPSEYDHPTHWRGFQTRIGVGYWF